MKTSIRRSSLAFAFAALASTATAQVTTYTQDFESLNAADMSALANDGWLVFGNVFDSGGGFLYNYGPFPAPNDPNNAGFSVIAGGMGGAAQGAQYLNAYNDYNNLGAHMMGELVEANLFQEFIVDASNANQTWTFSFDYLKNPMPFNGDGATTTQAFIKVLDPGNGFALVDFQTLDTTGASTSTWQSDSLSTTIDPAWNGFIFQIGFSSTASNFDDSGRFYDNVSFDAPGATGPSLQAYFEDFEAIDAADGASLGNAGWIGFANVFDSGGAFAYNYGTFPAPNGGPGFSAVASGQAGPFQGVQYLNIYSDYNNPDHGNGSNNQINALVFQEQIAGAVDVGNTWRFSFDYVQNGGNMPSTATTGAFLKVIKVSDGSFATLFEKKIDTTDADLGAWASSAIDIPVDPAFVGEAVQFGFESTASNFADTGRFYDNVRFETIANPGLGDVVCLGNPNSTGLPALLTATGSAVAADNNLTLSVDGLPANQFGIFVRSAGGIIVYNPAGSEGHLCIASFDVGRFNMSMLNSGATGSVSLALDLTALPGPNSVFAVMAGETDQYQYWSRDLDPMGAQSSTFSSAVSITYQ
ncbi:MAG: hypothetical protein AAFP86_09745 [Planctomycetota bacterium]